MAKYLALWDNQCGGYMHSGRNDTSLEDLKVSLLSYYSPDYEGDQDWDAMQDLDARELASLGDFTICSSDEKFDDDSDNSWELEVLTQARGVAS
jgi:hypothetical protein